MADQEEEDLQRALRLSMQQHAPPEPKRSKPRDNIAGDESDESPDVKNRRLQRELMAAAAEKRMMAAKTVASASASASASVSSARAPAPAPVSVSSSSVVSKGTSVLLEKGERGELKGTGEKFGTKLVESEANQLFSMVFGSGVSKDIIAQWTNQGIRFSSDPETSMGLVQHEGGPCGVLAAIQAFVLKYLLFSPDNLGAVTSKVLQNSVSRRLPPKESITVTNLASLTEDQKKRALVQSMSEILFLCGSNKRAVVASLDILSHDRENSPSSLMDEDITKALEGLLIQSGSDLQKVLRVNTYTSQAKAFRKLEEMLPVFQSRMGALLFLISALLSRGLDSVQGDRDDPSLSLVTAPFGHASQEIVNLLLCGQAVPNVFDGRMDLGGGMFLKGIATHVEVGFLTLLESLNFCKVGQYLKRPKWPIWVVGSESHYTVLFALDTSVQDENELEERESQIRKAFDAQDQSGGGGFISVEGFHQVLKEANIKLPNDKLDNLCSTGFIVWSELWQVLLDLDKSLGGMKDSTGLMGKKVFDLYHFNGIAKSVSNGTQALPNGESPTQRPRLTKLKVSVPPKWTPEEFMSDVAVPIGSNPNDSGTKDQIVANPEPPQHAPLVDCIRTRWPRAVCNWAGDPPSIV
ncbi:Ubiquitin interacting motif [Dillenia turbinata]|uniref:ubiquitinyl hydrolase 1 n=1 Tax=Dillenia turbinata TaxID=194707 RepID=A0AAN8ZEW6_9MAGN